MPIGPLLLTIGVLSIICFLWITKNKKVHENTINKIEFVEGWDVSRSVPLDVGGTIDLLVQSPTDQSYAIQIKTQYRHLNYKKTIFGEALELPDGRALKSPCPIDEALSNAQLVSATPILWLPFVPRARARVTKKGVTIVFGPKGALYKALKTKNPNSWI